MSVGFDALALAVLALLAWYGLYKYHQRRGVELEQRHAQHHGWEKVTIVVRQEIWRCPRCRAPMLTWDDVLAHRFSLTSPCAELEELQRNSAELEQAGAAADAAQSAGRWSASATLGGESHSGAVDTWEVDSPAAGELESGDE